MDILEQAFTWAKERNFNDMEFDYATILALKILDSKCKMSEEDQIIFMRVYDGMEAKDSNPFQLEMHQVIKDARTASSSAAKETMKVFVHQLRIEAEESMHRPTMKAYKAMVRQHLNF